VHRSTSTPAISLRESEDLGERLLQHFLHRWRDDRGEVVRAAFDVRERLGEELVVAAVRSVDGIAAAKADDGADRPALLSDARVRRPVHEPLAREVEDGLLEGTNEVQLREHTREKGGIRGLPVVCGGRELDPRCCRIEACACRHPSLFSVDGGTSGGAARSRP
jgi:hypothetical protein